MMHKWQAGTLGLGIEAGLSKNKRRKTLAAEEQDTASTCWPNFVIPAWSSLAQISSQWPHNSVFLTVQINMYLRLKVLDSRSYNFGLANTYNPYQNENMTGNFQDWRAFCAIVIQSFVFLCEPTNTSGYLLFPVFVHNTGA